jgi:hypothetical protein
MESSFHNNGDLMERAECPICSKLLFKIKPGLLGVIEIKCSGCDRFVILVFGLQPMLIATEQGENYDHCNS